MEEVIITYYKSPFGEMILGSFRDQLVLCDWRYRKKRKEVDDRIRLGLEIKYTEGKTATTDLAIQQLKEYFKGTRKTFDIPLLFVGTEFQQKVWNALLQIPYGTTRSYHELAQEIGKEAAVRAVAAANGANALSIFVPCHRIVGSNGELTGYAGGLGTKRELLRFESRDREGSQGVLFTDHEY